MGQFVLAAIFLTIPLVKASPLHIRRQDAFVTNNDTLAPATATSNSSVGTLNPSLSDSTLWTFQDPITLTPSALGAQTEALHPIDTVSSFIPPAFPTNTLYPFSTFLSRGNSGDPYISTVNSPPVSPTGTPVCVPSLNLDHGGGQVCQCSSGTLYTEVPTMSGLLNICDYSIFPTDVSQAEDLVTSLTASQTESTIITSANSGSDFTFSPVNTAPISSGPFINTVNSSIGVIVVPIGISTISQPEGTDIVPTSATIDTTSSLTNTNVSTSSITDDTVIFSTDSGVLSLLSITGDTSSQSESNTGAPSINTSIDSALSSTATSTESSTLIDSASASSTESNIANTATESSAVIDDSSPVTTAAGPTDSSSLDASESFTVFPAETPASSATDAFDDPSKTLTTLSISGVPALTYQKETFSDLSTITAAQTISTTAIETDSEGHTSTFIGPIVVGPGGVFWGPPGLPQLPMPPGVSPPCIWPFCSGGGETHSSGGEDGNESNDDPIETSSPTVSNDQPTTTGNPTTSPEPTTSEDLCTSSVIPLCTETVSLSTSFFSDNPSSSTVQTITSTVCTTITACEANPTTVTTTVSTTTSTGVYVCETECAACVDKRDMTLGVQSMSANVRVRSLDPLEDWESEYDSYVMEQTRSGGDNIELDWGSVREDAVSLFAEFRAAPLVRWITGIQGCTSITIISEKGLWTSHFMEPGFMDRNEWDIQRWNERIINRMQNGGPLFSNPSSLARDNGILHPANNVQILVSTPRQASGSLLYQSKVDTLLGFLVGEGAPWAGITPQIRGYLKPADDADAARYKNSARFKVLIEYDNNQVEDDLDDSPECNDQPPRVQRAIYRVWREQEPVQHLWNAATEQQNGPANNQKRDGTCSRPPESAIESPSTESVTPESVPTELVSTESVSTESTSTATSESESPPTTTASPTSSETPVETITESPVETTTEAPVEIVTVTATDIPVEIVTEIIVETATPPPLQPSSTFPPLGSNELECGDRVFAVPCDYVSSCGDEWMPLDDWITDDGQNLVGYTTVVDRFCEAAGGNIVDQDQHYLTWYTEVGLDRGKNPQTHGQRGWIEFEIHLKRDDMSYAITQDECVRHLTWMADEGRGDSCYGSRNRDTKGGTAQAGSDSVSFHALGNQLKPADINFEELIFGNDAVDPEWVEG